ncbi:unnamed protein product [Caenorhabditis brenneri]
MALSLFDFLDFFDPIWKDLRTPDLNRLRALGGHRISFANRQGELIGDIQFVQAPAARFTFFHRGERFTLERYFAVKYGVYLDYPFNRMVGLEPGHLYPQEVLRVERI